MSYRSFEGGTKMKYGLIGKKLGHSYSKIIHEMIAPYTYELKEIPPEELDAFMKERDFLGINVTIPYKTDVIPYLDYIDPTAETIGAVNTVVNREGKLYGYNTDIIGITYLIKSVISDLSGKKALIAGSGGTSKTAAAALSSLGCNEYYIVGRTAKDGIINYAEAYEKHYDADLIINTTPLGMYPDFDSLAFDLTKFTRLSGVVDVVYNPLRTSLVLSAEKLGIPAVSGLFMLVAQAAAASRFFIGITPDTTNEAVYNTLRADKLNIVLTGMPGSGKSTVGKRIAKQLGRTFIDTDEEIVKTAGIPIPEIFEKYGEVYFRDLESRVIRELSTTVTGAVIATGGGAILRDENIKNLKFNGHIFFLDRPLCEIVPTSDRPLSSSEDMLIRRYNERISIYLSTADTVIKTAGTPKKTASLIIKEVKE